ncbi:unnamed protein product [Triticum turgidum subsp. durum]|uniref:Uncharacterized protein n=1 Tax=Triticum turgidum subsp. durum TaxID=4567 RepID=A0A9R0YKI3_TRITD|nr:unnamed protein product [Triticum turgidum subsp. durum]
MSEKKRRVRRFQKQTEKMVKLLKETLAAEAAEAAEEARLFNLEHPHQVVSSTPFQEKEFGDKPLQTIRASKDITPDLSAIVVSLALFDGSRMLFACSGLAIPSGTTKLELRRFVTSRRLVEEFNKNRNIDDKLRIDVCLPDNTHMDGFLGLYDKDIAIVTSCDFTYCAPTKDVCPVNLDLHAPLPSDGKIIAAARAFGSGRLMVTSGLLTGNGIARWEQITEAALGGPLVDQDAKFLGVNIRVEGPSSWFLPLMALCKRLENFQLLSSRTTDFRGYSLPPFVSSIIPSGFWFRIKQLDSLGYPRPPPLVLEFNGELLETFEEKFGQLLAWKGYPYSVSNPRSREYVWPLLPRDVVTNISRSVVKLASFNGSVRSFACTGLLIKWPGTEGTRTVILTSASLVRSRDDHFKIDNNLTIDVFLPPKQHAKGTLVFYHLNANLAIVSLDKGIRGIRPFDICHKGDLSKPVVAIARKIEAGFLMASKGEVVEYNPRDSYFEKLMLSTCKINKAGIGGPLINFDGAFVGMNHYDGSEVTPFMPRREIVQILKGEVNWRRQSGLSMDVLHGVGCGSRIHRRRWPVPEPYWYHGLLTMDKYDLHPHIGRQLQ